jgi:hypothetical protein
LVWEFNVLIRLIVSSLWFFGLAAGVSAEGTASIAEKSRETIGWGRFFNNDYLGDRDDRWHTSSYSVSRLRGPTWTGELPRDPGQILEFRFRVDTITPADMVTPLTHDRRYVGILSFGFHTHFRTDTEQMSFGGDLVFIGPQTGVSRFQDYVHDGLGLPQGTVFDNQLPNAVYPALTGEIGHPIALGDHLTLRPFVEGQAGVEYLMRGGADIILGKLGRDDLLLRDQTTGQRYSAAQGPDGGGLSLTLGGDVARVFSSVYLPAGGDAEASPLRTRLRAGLNWQGKQSFVFMGLTYLSPEFQQQPVGQTIGSLSLQIKF